YDLSTSLQGYQVSLRSTRGPIDVFLCPDDNSSVCSPVTGGSPSKASADPPMVPPPAQPTEPAQARTSTAALEVGLSSPASTSSTVTAASQQDPSALVLGGDTVSQHAMPNRSWEVTRSPASETCPTSTSHPSPLRTFLNGEGLSLTLDGFINLSPPHSHDYHFGLEDHEGISELFDCDFGDLSQVLGDS
ncbi:Transcription factor E2F1, partial [Nibea albiflora]